MAAEYDQRLVVETYTRAIAYFAGRHAARAS
jgi:hypothetical protein